ncbi:hypothetical protein CkaCkLH20_05092 [Colletotrichum karsti]|uniref:Uncharacterized protein n=1 Tax=Colletotrichum karsti TaxID=1095194 RepID=A0A9P6I5P8_9PEZI|nr:uncharacterized protein CkaCkLH20_05092 [Colletotrichum karsti]KAF9877392.1 hypothetical protein CkaCkLH20_05092 [Colletotrichum karsti]
MCPRGYQVLSTAYTENLVGEKYHIQSHKLSDDFLDVYVVTDENGNHFEAQAFTPVAKMPRESEGLCQARRRRMKRICRSHNFADEFEHEGRRFLVSKVRRNDKDWMDLQAQVGGRSSSSSSSEKTENILRPAAAAEGFVAEASSSWDRQEDDGLGPAVLGSSAQHRINPSYSDALARNTRHAAGEPDGRRRLFLALGNPKRV